MTEESAPPPSPAKPVPPEAGRLWAAWLLSTMVLPSVAGLFLSVGSVYAYVCMLLLVCASLGLHLGACIRLAPELTCLSFFLAVGGWVLMAASFFAGCVLMAIR
ncbi:hypothetical protein [Prosthecobacter vanneervenii]|uniref:Uncharacterized protein n=1 Tax=Prosthecobacter vanneervenii TaxID=48466 RepID=A0A7W7Y7M6_9BACT|nr:hypothetical protein [Prosthecobacter vanneervenii]MBB5030720.1 hypothetical protein [Prosthecobacter vanneervenii]